MKYNIFFFVACIFVFLPVTSYAGDFVNLVGIPGIDSDELPNLSEYINALYRLSISIAALLAVIKIVIAGAKYMLSDIITHKEEAKKDIQGALIGLLIVIGAIIILNTVNTDLTSIEINMASTTVRQSPTIQDIIALQQRNLAALEDRARDAQSDVIVQNCPTYSWLGFGLDSESRARCRQECEQSRGQFTLDLLWGNTCTYSEAEAVACSPSSGTICCESVHGGDWSEGPPRACSGVDAARDERRLQCGQEERVWDEAGNYCRTASCNLNTDANCCAAAGRTIQNGICSTTPNDVTDEQECIDRGAGWVYINGTCRAQTPGNVTQPLPTPRPADPYTYCFRIAPQGTWEFNEAADFCQIIPTN